MVLYLGLCPCICCLCQDTTPLRCDDHHCTSSPAQLQHLAQPRPAAPSQCPVAFTLSLTDSTRARHACGTHERLRTLRGRFATALTTIAGQELDRTSDVVHSHDYSFGRMNMPFLVLIFFDDICVARVCLRARGSYLALFQECLTIAP